MIVVFTFLFMSVFSALKALVNITSGTSVLSGRNGLPGVGNTLLSSTMKAAMNTVYNASAIAAFMRDTSNITRNKHAKLASLMTTVLFKLSLLLSPVFLTVPSFTATPTLVVIKFLVLASMAGVSFGSVARTVPTFVTVVTVPFLCDVSRNVSVNIVSCIVVGIIANGTGRGGVDMLVCMLTILFVLGCVFV